MFLPQTSLGEIFIYPGIFLALYFALFVLSNFFAESDKIYTTKKKKINFPAVSLIVPCYNEQDNIEVTLQSLLNLNYPQEKLKIIVVDDGSTDKTLERVKRLAQQTKRVDVFHKENGGKWTALNYGLKKTKTAFVGSVDADSYLEPDALCKIMEKFQDKKTMAVIGTVKIGKPRNILEWVQYVEYLLGAFLRQVFARLESVNVTPGPLSVFRREVFEKLGDYRSGHQTEDLEMAFRLQRANFKIVHVVRAIVWTQPCSNFRSLLRQRLRWRRGFLLNLKDYPDLLNIKKHGNLCFLLFYGLLSCFISFTFFGYLLWSVGYFIFKKINQLWLIGFDLPTFFSFSFDQFLFNLRPLLVLSFVALIIFWVFLSLSKKITNEKRTLKKGVVFYLLLFNFLETIWWLVTLCSLIFKKEPSWE